MLEVEPNARDKFAETCRFAAEHDLLAAWLKTLAYLDGYANGEGCTYDQKSGKNTRCTLSPDFAPLSFRVSMERKKGYREDFEPWIAGGLIYHGPVPETAEGAGRSNLTVDLSSDDAPHWGFHT
jgi:hypothetical protein